MIDLETLRADTPGTQHVVHLNNAGASLMPKPIVQAITGHIALEAEIGGYEAAELRRDDIRGFYTATADLLNAVRARGNRVIAVGTTSLRLIESATGEDRVVRGLVRTALAARSKVVP